jgi:predicted nucleotidyltransferase
MEIPQEQLGEIIRRIVDAVHPERIILFGSAVRGEMNSESDVDMLVVMPEGTNRRRIAAFFHTRLFGIPLSVDIMVTTPSLLEEHKDNIGMIYRTILAAGKELYAA